MRIFQMARKPPQWLRVTFAALLLAFALDSVAQVAHSHEVLPSEHHSVCAYCVSFDDLIDVPRYSLEIVSAGPATNELLFPPDFALPHQPRTTDRSRGPPFVS
jgi:hypothetical protein